MDESNFPTTEGSLTLPFAPLSSLLSDVPSEPEWTWDGYLAPSCVTLLAGVPKGGKTTKAFGLFKALAEGSETFLGRPVRKTGVLLLTEERSGTLAEKHDRWQLPENVHVLTKADAAGVAWETVVQLAVAHCKANGLGVLVVDTLSEWTGLAGDDENNAGAMLGKVQPLQAAAASGLAVLVIAHHRKSGGRHGEGVRGSNALAGAVDVILDLVRPEESLAREGVRLLFGTSRFSKTPAELAIVVTDEGYEARESVDGLRAERDKTRLIEALADVGSATASDLAEALDIPKATVTRHLNQLYGDERIGRTGRGVKGDPFMFHSEFDSSTPTPKDESNLTLDTEVAA